jgi:short-subunit dehydrogenase
MAKRSRNLSGRTAIVTGASGGVGSALTQQLAREGVKVAMLDLDQGKLDAVAAQAGGETLPLGLDVSDLEAYTNVFAQVEERLGPVDFLCNVAAIMPISPFEAERPAVTQKILDVNLHAVIRSTQEAARRMKRRGEGHIINVASGAGWLAGGGVATYCASKFGLVGYSESVAMELRGTGVDISVVAPAIVKTQMSTGLKDVRGVRAVEPEEVAAAIVNTLKNPGKFAVFVPPSIGALSLIVSGMPYRIRHMITRLSRTDLLLLKADMSKRADYESRVTGGATAPSADSSPTTGVR